VAHHFAFSSEIVSMSNIITSKVVHGLGMTEKNWLSNLNGFSLYFHSVVGVNRVDNPSADIVVIRVDTGFLLARLRGIAKSAQGSAAEVKSLSVNVRICLNFDFLAVPDDIVSAENVCFLCSLKNEDRTGNRSRVLFAGSEDKSFTSSALLFLVNIHNKVSTSRFVLHHDGVSRSHETIFRASPWNILSLLFESSESFFKW